MQNKKIKKKKFIENNENTIKKQLKIYDETPKDSLNDGQSMGNLLLNYAFKKVSLNSIAEIK